MPLILLFGGLLILGAFSVTFPSAAPFAARPAVILVPARHHAPYRPVRPREPYAATFTQAPNSPEFTFTPPPRLPARMRLFDPCRRTEGPWADTDGDGVADNLIDLSGHAAANHDGYEPGTEFEPRNEPVDCDDAR